MTTYKGEPLEAFLAFREGLVIYGNWREYVSHFEFIQLVLSCYSYLVIKVWLEVKMDSGKLSNELLVA